MLKNYNNEAVLNEYIDYLKDKGKITKIKDSSQNMKIKFSNGITFYFLSFASIVLIILTIFLINSIFINPSNTQNNEFMGSANTQVNESDAVVVIGVALFTIIIIAVTFNEKKHISLNINYPHINQIKINNQTFDIEKEDCYLDIIKKYEYTPDPYDRRHISRDSHTVKYLLEIKGKNKSKSFEIKNGTEEKLRNFIYNFEYEISDSKMEKSEFIKNAQNAFEELYKNKSESH